MTAIQYISQLGSAAARSATDLIPVTQGSTGALTGTTRKMTVDQLFTSPAFTGTTTLGSNFANYATVVGGAAGNPATFTAAGSDANVDLTANGKGTGRFNSTKVYFGAQSDRGGANSLTPVVWKNRITYSGAGAPGWRAGGAFSGTFTSGEGTLNYVAIDADTIDCVTGGGPGLLSGFGVGHAVGGGSAAGGRVAMSSFLNVGGAIAAGAGTTSSFLVSVAGFAQASASAGGTAGAGNARGNLFGSNFSTRLLSGAGLYWNSLVGSEINVGTPTGTAAVYKVGLQVVQWGDDTVAGTAGTDSALSIISQTSAGVAGWDRGLTFGHSLGWWGIKSTGTLIGTVPANVGGGPTYAAAYGVDFRSVTFSSAAFASSGFSVDGTGLTTTNGLLTNGMIILGSGGPRITTGSGAPPVVLSLAKGSLYIRVDGGVGSTIYVSQGGGTWNAIAGV